MHARALNRGPYASRLELLAVLVGQSGQRGSRRRHREPVRAVGGGGLPLPARYGAGTV